MDELDISLIQNELQDIKVVLSDLDSTMDYWHQNKISCDSLVIQEKQIKGRGRGEKIFVSKRGGLYMSLILKRKIEISLPLRVGLAVSYALRDYFVKSLIKWPNDIFCNNKKLCGILLQSNHEKSLINIGIGLNVFNDLSDVKDIATSLKDLGIPAKREDLAILITKAYLKLEKLPLSQIIDECKLVSYDLINNLAKDIDSEGFLVNLNGERVVNPVLGARD